MKVLTCGVGRSLYLLETCFQLGEDGAPSELTPRSSFSVTCLYLVSFIAHYGFLCFQWVEVKCVFELNKGRRLALSSFPLLCVSIFSFNINLETAGKFFLIVD